MVTLSLGKHFLDFANSLNELKNQLSSSCKVELQITQILGDELRTYF